MRKIINSFLYRIAYILAISICKVREMLVSLGLCKPKTLKDIKNVFRD